MVVRAWKQPKYSSAGGWVNTLWSIRAMEFCAAAKWSEDCFNVLLWGDFPDAVLSEKNKVEKSVFSIQSLI